MVDVDSRAANISVVLQVTNGKLTIGGTVPGEPQRCRQRHEQGDVGRSGELDRGGTRRSQRRDVPGQPELLRDGHAVRTADDRGNTGSGGAQTAAKFTTIVVTAVNDPPIVANPVADFSVDEDSPNTLIELFPGVFADPDNTTLTLTVTGNTNPTLVAAAITGTRLTLSYLPNQSGRSATIRVRASDGPSFGRR